MALNLIVMGPPGAGKGTQAELFADLRGLPKISTGDMLRESAKAGTDVGLRARAIMDQGQLIDDDVMFGIVRERLSQPDAAGGFVLDGFPRTVAQAESLDRLMEGRDPLVVVDIMVPEGELIRRLASRTICEACGANGAAPEDLSPAADGGASRCRRCGGRLTHRVDDDEAVVRARLKVYWRDTKPLVHYYRLRPTFRAINGAQPPGQVAAELAASIDGNGLAKGPASGKAFS